MPKSRRKKRYPPAAPPSPSSPTHLLTSSILIQTDDGRRFDSSIQYNRIVDDPFQRRKTRHTLRSIIALAITIAIFTYLLVSESMGFASLPLAVTDRKYLGRKPNVGNTTEENLLSSRTSHDVIDELVLADDDIDDELRVTDDDNTDVDGDEDNNFESNRINPGYPPGSKDRLEGSTSYRNTSDVDNGVGSLSDEIIEGSGDINNMDDSMHRSKDEVGNTGESYVGASDNKATSPNNYSNGILGEKEYENPVYTDTDTDTDTDSFSKNTENNHTTEGADNFDHDFDAHFNIEENRGSLIESIENEVLLHDGHVSSMNNDTLSEVGADASSAENMNENEHSNSREVSDIEDDLVDDENASQKEDETNGKTSSSKQWPW